MYDEQARTSAHQGKPPAKHSFYNTIEIIMAESERYCQNEGLNGGGGAGNKKLTYDELALFKYLLINR